MIETPEYAAMMRRMVRAYGRRVAEADPEDLHELVKLREDLEEAIGRAARAQAQRTSWAMVAKGLRVTREAAWQRYGRTPKGVADSQTNLVQTSGSHSRTA